MRIGKEKAVLSLIIFAGIFVRVLVFYHERFIGIDGVELARLGKNLVESGNYVFGENYNWGMFFPPAYPVLTGLLNLLYGDLFVAGKLVSVAASIVTIPLFYLIGKEIYGREAGLFSAFVYSLHPAILKTSAQVATESLSFMLLILSIYIFVLLCRKSSMLLHILLGISAGLSYLTRSEGILIILLSFLSLKGWRELKNRGALARLGMTLLVFIIIASPYPIFLKKATGSFMLSGKSIYLPVLLEAGIVSSDVTYDRAVYTLSDDKTYLNGFGIKKGISLAGYVSKEPLKFIKKYIWNIREAAEVLFKLLLPFILPLMLAFFRKDIFQKKGIWVLLFFSSLYFFMYPSFLILERHMYPIVLLLIIFSSEGFVSANESVSKLIAYYGKGDSRLLAILAARTRQLFIAILILGCLYSANRAGLFRESVVPLEHMRAGHFIKENFSAEYERVNVMHRVPWISYYSDARFTMLPYAGFKDVVDFAKRYRVDLIAVDDRTQMTEWESYNQLKYLDKYSDEVELVYEDISERFIRLFKVRYE